MVLEKDVSIFPIHICIVQMEFIPILHLSEIFGSVLSVLFARLIFSSLCALVALYYSTNPLQHQRGAYVQVCSYHYCLYLLFISQTHRPLKTSTLADILLVLRGLLTPCLLFLTKTLTFIYLRLKSFTNSFY